MSKPPPLWDHQKKTKKFGRKVPTIFDMSDPGTGKTRGHIELFAERRRKNGGKLFVSAPRTLMSSVWLEEIQTYAPDLNTVIASADNRQQAIELAKSKDIDVIITNTDAVKVFLGQPKKFWNGFDSYIIDESSYYKHRTSARSKAAAKLRRYFEYITLMSGSPFNSSVTELWHQVFILDGGQRLGNNFWRFQAACCEPVQTGPNREHIEWVDKPYVEDSVSKLLEDVSLRFEFDKVMNIPDNTIRPVYVDLSKKLRKQYDSMEKTTVSQLESGKIVTAVNKAVAAGKLLQIASGAVYGSTDDDYHVIDTERYELTKELVNEVKHSLIFYRWNHQYYEIAKQLKNAGISFAYINSSMKDDQIAQIRREFQAGKYRSLLLHPRTGAHGLTLTKASRIILPSPIYEADLFKQLMHRIRRGTQKQKTETICIAARDTLDIGVLERRQKKTEKLTSLLDLIESSRR